MKSILENSPMASISEQKNILTFQERVEPWLLQCFGETIAADVVERNHRFLEEALELVQACGATQSEAHQLVDYVSVDICKPEVAALESVRQPRVIYPEQPHDGGLQIVHVHSPRRQLILCRANGIACGISDIVAVGVRLTVRSTSMGAAACHPDRKTARVVVPAVILVC